MSGYLPILASPFLSAGIALSFFGLHRSRQPLHVYWALFAAGIFFFSVKTAFGAHLGWFAAPVAIFGSATCGLGWLLARALFRPASAREIWPVVVVASLYVTGAFGILMGPETGGLGETIQNIHRLTSSTVLLLTMIEAVQGFSRNMPKSEQRFRLTFIGGYSAMVLISVLWSGPSAEGANAALLDDTIKVVCALCALLLSGYAVSFRIGHPLASASASPPKRRPPDSIDSDLRRRLTRLIEEQEVYKSPDLKVADLARLAREPDYKVSQCITGAMGFQNFNRLINHHRIACAKRMLADPQCDGLSILAVAMECGFGSIGPFNRAFKESEGMTPGRYRAQSRGDFLQK